MVGDGVQERALAGPINSSSAALLGQQSPEGPVPTFRTLQLKMDFKARGDFVKIWSSEQIIEEADWLECPQQARRTLISGRPDNRDQKLGSI